jgi:excisionase family DNA binding protein
MDDDILTIEELAAFLKLPKQSIYQMTRKRGQTRHNNPLPFCRIGEQKIRFRKSAIEAWLERCSEGDKVGQ